MDTVTLPTLDCKRCLHTWHPNREMLPKVCPKCKSPYWNRERKNRVGGAAALGRELGISRQAAHQRIQRERREKALLERSKKPVQRTPA